MLNFQTLIATKAARCVQAARGQRLAGVRIDSGDPALPGKPLFKLVRQQTVRIRAQLPTEDLPRLQVGQPVTLTPDDLELEEKVSRVFPAMTAAHLAALEVDLTNPPPGLVSGATVGVDVHSSTAEGLSVVADALLEGDQGAHVFVVRDGMVHPVTVKVVDRSLDRAVVEGELKAGDRVIIARPARLMTLAEGMHVVEVAEAKRPEGIR